MTEYVPPWTRFAERALVVVGLALALAAFALVMVNAATLSDDAADNATAVTIDPWPTTYHGVPADFLFPINADEMSPQCLRWLVVRDQLVEQWAHEDGIDELDELVKSWPNFEADWRDNCAGVTS